MTVMLTSEVEAEVLVHLREIGPATIHQIADRAQMPVLWVATQVARLHNHGLIVHDHNAYALLWEVVI